MDKTNANKNIRVQIACEHLNGKGFTIRAIPNAFIEASSITIH